MDVHCSGQKDQVEELHDDPLTIAQISTNDIKASEQKFSSLNINKSCHAKCLHQQKSNHERSSGPIKSIEKETVVKNINRAGDHNASDVDEHNDDTDVIVEQLRFGCEKNLQNHEYESNVPLDTLELKTPLCNNANENVPTKNRQDIRNSNPINYSHNSLCTPSSSVIPLAGQNTTKTKCVSGMLDRIETSKIGGDTTQGKNVEQSIIIRDCTNSESLATNNPVTYELACETANITNYPLHARNISNHFHQHHKNSLNHDYNLLKNECFSNELTNALSSRLLYQITNFPHCTNLDSNNISKRQSSFFKSQSLEIAQDTPLVLYNGIDNIVHPFFQLSEAEKINEEKEMQLNYAESDHQADKNLQKNTSNNLLAIDCETKEEFQANKNDDNEEGVEQSLLPQKTGAALKSQSLESRPIYPNVPYSPYASPYNSPRANRRRPPLRESRRISIEQSGSFLQLNQYKLMDQIGQVSTFTHN